MSEEKGAFAPIPTSKPLRTKGMPLGKPCGSIAHRAWSHMSDYLGVRFSSTEIATLVECDVAIVTSTLRSWVACGAIKRDIGTDGRVRFWVDAS